MYKSIYLAEIRRVANEDEFGESESLRVVYGTETE